MIAKLLLKILRKRGVQLFASKGRLCWKDPENALTWVHVDEIRKYKGELLEILGNPKAEIIRLSDYR